MHLCRWRGVELVDKALGRIFYASDKAEELILGQFVVTFTVAAPQTETTVAMIGHDNHERLSVLLGKVKRHGTSLVKGHIFGKHTHGIVAMRRPVYFTSFNHQEKAIFVFGQFLEGLSCHLFEGRLLGRIAI